MAEQSPFQNIHIFPFLGTYFDFYIDYGTLRFFSFYKLYWGNCDFLTRPTSLPQMEAKCCAVSASWRESHIGPGSHLEPSSISSLSSTRINLSPFTKDFRGEWHLNESLQFIKAISSEVVSQKHWLKLAKIWIVKLLWGRVLSKIFFEDCNSTKFTLGQNRK